MVRVKWRLSWGLVVLVGAASCQVNTPVTQVSVTSPRSTSATEAETPIPDTATPELTATTLPEPSITLEAPEAFTWHTLVEGQFFRELSLSSFNRSLYFIGVISDVTGLWRLDLSTSSEPVRVSDSFGAVSLALSPDGSEAVLSGESIHVVALESGETLVEVVPANQFCLATFVTDTRLVRACTTIGQEPSLTVVDTYDVSQGATTELARYPGFPGKLEAKPGANVLILGVRADPPYTDEVVILDARDGTIRCKISSTDFSVAEENDTQLAIDGGNHRVAFVNFSDCGETSPISLQLGAGVFRFFATTTLVVAGAGPQVELVQFDGPESQAVLASELPKPYVVQDIIGGPTPRTIYVAAFDESTNRYAILEGGR